MDLFYEVGTKSDGDCFFEAVAIALRKHVQHFACFFLQLKYQCVNDGRGGGIHSRHIRSVVADSVMELPDTSSVWDQWQNCIAVPEMRHEYAFALPLLQFHGQPVSTAGGVPVHVREQIRNNMMNKRYWAEQFALLTVARTLKLHVYVIEIEHDRTAMFRYEGAAAAETHGSGGDGVPNTIIVVQRREHYTLLARRGSTPQYMFCEDEAAAACTHYLEAWNSKKGSHCHSCGSCNCGGYDQS